MCVFQEFGSNDGKLVSVMSSYIWGQKPYSGWKAR